MSSHQRVKALFVNAGILGLRTFARFVDEEVVHGVTDVDAAQVVVSEALSLRDRLIRRILCTRLWPDGLAGVNNLDLARFRAEWNAGLVARRKIEAFERERGRVDVLHFHGQAVAYGSLARMLTTPTIISSDCTQEIMVSKAGTALERWSYTPNLNLDGRVFRAARLIIAASNWAADSIRRQYPDCATEIVVMPVAVQLDAFDERWADERAARVSAGYKPRVLFVGGDFVRKGGYELLRVWRDGEFADRAELHVVSDWPIEDAWLGRGVTRHTGIASRSGRWRAMWRDADIFALPTRDEAFGMVYQEAAAAGLPLIGTSINAVPELIQEGRTGMLVPPSDADALERALSALIDSASLRESMGKAARRHVVARADSAVYRGRLLDAIHRLADNARRPAASTAAFAGARVMP